jgi:luciferase family oxidoreductase group 1
MLPNHSPLVIAEQFGTLEALFPGRIDLGVGRSSGTDQVVTAALGRDLKSESENFPKNILRLQDYMSDSPRQRVLAVPGQGAKVPIWILGSSLVGAKLAAHLGLPFAFASQFAPLYMADAVKLYRSEFRPSDQLARPYLMLGYNVFGAATDEEAALLATSAEQTMILRYRGRAAKVPPPVNNYRESLSEQERAMLDLVMACTAIGSVDTITSRLEAFIASMQPDELIVASQIYDHEARLKSYEILTEVRRRLQSSSEQNDVEARERTAASAV